MKFGKVFVVLCALALVILFNSPTTAYAHPLDGTWVRSGYAATDYVDWTEVITINGTTGSWRYEEGIGDFSAVMSATLSDIAITGTDSGEIKFKVASIADSYDLTGGYYKVGETYTYMYKMDGQDIAYMGDSDPSGPDDGGPDSFDDVTPFTRSSSGGGDGGYDSDYYGDGSNSGCDAGAGFAGLLILAGAAFLKAKKRG